MAVEMGDYNLSAEDANLAKHLLINIAQAVCCRLDVIDDQLEGICQSTKYLVDQMQELLTARGSDLKSGSSPSPRKQRKRELEHTSDTSVNVIHLNKEEDFPNGSWLGDENNPFKRVRVSVPPRQLERINVSSTSAVKMSLLLLDYLFDRDMQAISNVSGTGKHGKHRLDPLLMYGIQCHVEKHFSITSEDWKQIQIHIDSKCRSAYRCKSRGLPRTSRAFRRRAAEQTASHIHGLGTSSAESWSSDAGQQPEQNSLIAEDEQTSDLTLESGACHVYTADESGETIRLVCIPVSQLTSSTVNGSESTAVSPVSQMPS